jgi:hypothetical protein
VKTESPRKPAAPPEERTLELVRDGERVRRTQREGEWTAVEVATPQRCFYLAKKAGDARFETRSLRTGPRAYQWTLESIRAYAGEAEAPYLAEDAEMVERMKSPSFTLTRAVRSQEGPQRRVTVYFEDVIPSEFGPLAHGGWLRLRPDECWALDAYELRTRCLEPEALPTDYKGRTELPVFAIHQGVVRYRGSENGVPVLESVERKVLERMGRQGAPLVEQKIIEGDKWRYTRRFQVTEIQFRPTPDETFDLASFDADPPAQEPHSAASPKERREDIFVRLTRWLVWAIWSCSAGVVLSAVLSRFTNHKGTKNTKAA